MRYILIEKEQAKIDDQLYDEKSKSWKDITSLFTEEFSQSSLFRRKSRLVYIDSLSTLIDISEIRQIGIDITPTFTKKFLFKKKLSHYDVVIHFIYKDTINKDGCISEIKKSIYTEENLEKLKKEIVDIFIITESETKQMNKLVDEIAFHIYLHKEDLPIINITYKTKIGETRLPNIEISDELMTKINEEVNNIFEKYVSDFKLELNNVKEINKSINLRKI